MVIVAIVAMIVLNIMFGHLHLKDFFCFFFIFLRIWTSLGFLKKFVSFSFWPLMLASLGFLFFVVFLKSKSELTKSYFGQL